MLRRLVRFTVYGLLLAVVLLLTAAFAMYRSTPKWYQPRQFSETELQQASSSLNSQLGQFHNQAAVADAEQPFTLTITQEQANQYLQALPRLYDQRLRLPAGLTEPMIVFQRDRLVLAGRHPKMGDHPISLHMTLRVEPEQVTFAVESIQIGALPMPRRFVEDQLSELRHRLNGAAGNADQNDRSTGQLLALGKLLFAALDGQPIPREFITPNSRRLVRVDRIELTAGQLAVTFAPKGSPPEGPRWTPEQIRGH